MKVGDYVEYIPFEGCDKSIHEKGRIKSLCEDENYVFVVFKCENRWSEFQNYTGQKTKVSDLIKL